MNNLFKSFRNTIIYIYEGFGRIFSLTKDIYPTVGVSPFEGDPCKNSELKD